VYACRDSDGASPNPSDSSDVKDDDDRNRQRQRDVMTSRPAAIGPQGATQTSFVQSSTTSKVDPSRGIVNHTLQRIITIFLFVIRFFFPDFGSKQIIYLMIL